MVIGKSLQYKPPAVRQTPKDFDGLLGDFNRDSKVDALDIDLLASALRTEVTEDIFDLTGDAQVTADDMDLLIHDISFLILHHLNYRKCRPFLEDVIETQLLLKRKGVEG